ncbi:AI-2E family transporter [Allopontixanthobacter sediminis]|uniref:AI-2E family transporter n=1 Tax=Allopontixanthobacter sediminis TaxID=1689985 RepID=A0A845B3C7_9SPHN|nr:AI-2E family transporter [Allopontixanthobacter sediminis]MXP44082.1 AI-2E family transporter [Allopontixanthobacter sediminis]
MGATVSSSDPPAGPAAPNFVDASAGDARPGFAAGAAEPRDPASRRKAFAEQELRLISALVVILGAGLFLALPFVLSIGSVVFLPVVTAIVLMIILSPLADKLARWGLPNVFASLVALLSFFAIMLLALALILQPAVDLYDRVPAMANQAAERFGELRDQFAWIAIANEELAQLTGQSSGREVVLASPSVIEQLAFATPSVVLETLLTLLMTFFMIEARVRMRKHLLFDRTSFGTSIKAARAIREMQDRVAAYIFTVAWINGIVGVIVAGGAWAMGVEAPVMWGGLAALLNFIPYIGPLVMTALLALFGIGTAETALLGVVPALAYLGLHAVEANIVTPSILGARFTMNPVMILIALSYFSWVWGVFGALLSVPILLMLTAFFDNVGRPNLIGFIFGEPLFATNLLDLAEESPPVRS